MPTYKVELDIYRLYRASVEVCRIHLNRTVYVGSKCELGRQRGRERLLSYPASKNPPPVQTNTKRCVLNFIQGRNLLFISFLSLSLFRADKANDDIKALVGILPSFHLPTLASHNHTASFVGKETNT